MRRVRIVVIVVITATFEQEDNVVLYTVLVIFETRSWEDRETSNGDYSVYIVRMIKVDYWANRRAELALFLIVI